MEMLTLHSIFVISFTVGYVIIIRGMESWVFNVEQSKIIKENSIAEIGFLMINDYIPLERTSLSSPNSHNYHDEGFLSCMLFSGQLHI